MNFKKVLLLLYTLYAIPYTLSYADTINTNDGKELKGIVVEDYKDRLILSTADGEITVMKADIRELYYDSEEDNLIKLAEQARERRDYTKSYAYYNMAFKLNPNSKAAKDGLVFLQGYLFRQEQVRKEDDIKLREDFERSGSPIKAAKAEEDAVKEMAETLKKTIGVTLGQSENFPVVENVSPKSAASEAGVKPGDKLVAIWARLTGYMNLKDVMAALLDKPSLELKCTIERTVNVPVAPRDLIGATLAMEFDGLTISEVKEDTPAFGAGLKKGDLITAIEGKSTRYMPLKTAITEIKKAKGSVTALTLRREVLIWRKD